MIQSRSKTFEFGLLLITSTFFILLAFFTLLNYYLGTTIMNIRPRAAQQAFFQAIGPLIAGLIFFAPLFRYAHKITVDSVKRTITFKNIFTKYEKTYLFTDFVGYFRMHRRDLRWRWLR